MSNSLEKLVFKLPVVSRIREKQAELERRAEELNQRQEALARQRMELDREQVEAVKFRAFIQESQKTIRNSVDYTPWRHPYLHENNIRRFREYSEGVWKFAQDYSKECARPLKIAFVVNMAQNMHKWARLAKKHGAEVALYPHVMDQTAINSPEWEDFDGEHSDVCDGKGFIEANSDIKSEIPNHRIPMQGNELYSAFQAFCSGTRTPLLKLLSRHSELRHEVLLSYRGVYPYYRWASELLRFDVIYATSVPIAAYASGRPYCVVSCGGDLQFDSGRGDDYGEVMTLSFNAARFLFVSNPHTLAHSRRLGLTNGVYLPYPMDDSRYYPGNGEARKAWESRYGLGVYILTSSRVDEKVKGHDETFFQVLADVARQRPELRFIFLDWGESATIFRSRIQASGLSAQFIVLNPVGKKRLIDYYRSCDIVLDHFVYGYYGTTALEAAAIGKPVVMKIRSEHYAPLYKGDVAPVMNTGTPAEVGRALLRLVDHPEFRWRKGEEMRSWLVRNHGEEKTVPLMLALLRLAADRVNLPADLLNPLHDEESDEEKAYHAACLT